MAAPTSTPNILDVEVLEVRSLASGKITGMFDMSGSMTHSARIKSTTDFINQLQVERMETLLLWSDRILANVSRPRSVSPVVSYGASYNTMLINNVPYVASGGTMPSVLNREHPSTELLVFCTDGQIDDAEVTSFARGFHHDCSMVLCVIIGETDEVGNINVSVVAPFLSAQHLILYVYNSQVYVLGGSNIEPVDIHRPLAEFPRFDAANLSMELCAPTPPGYTRVGMKLVINDITKLTIDDLLSIDTPALLLRAKTTGNVNIARQHLHNLRAAHPEHTAALDEWLALIPVVVRHEAYTMHSTQTMSASCARRDGYSGSASRPAPGATAPAWPLSFVGSTEAPGASDSPY